MHLHHHKLSDGVNHFLTKYSRRRLQQATKSTACRLHSRYNKSQLPLYYGITEMQLHIKNFFSKAKNYVMWKVQLFTGNLSQNYGASHVIWEHVVLPASRHRWMRATLTPARQTGTWTGTRGSTNQKRIKQMKEPRQGSYRLSHTSYSLSAVMTSNGKWKLLQDKHQINK